MKKTLSSVLAASAVVLSQASFAGTDLFFNPLTQSAPVSQPNSVNELTSPWQVPAGISQDNLTSMAEIEADAFGQTTVRVSENGVGGPSRLSNATMWDMVAYDETGQYIYIPHETFTGAGVTRYDVENDFAEVLFQGDEAGLTGDWTNDWGAFDPATYTPNGTLFAAEEWSGEGRVMEVLNPKAAAHDIEVRELTSIANVSHEGLRFSKDEKTLYFVDENRSGSIYKFVMKRKGDYTVGQTFVLSVDAFDGDASLNYNDEVNEGEVRTGLATWIPLTNRNGSKIKTPTNPFEVTAEDNRPGRTAADEVGATPFGRPEDMEVTTLANGNEAVFFAATSETAIYSIEMLSKRKAIVKLAVEGGVTPQNLGHLPTTGVLNSPDNLAQDALGNIFIIEDAPNSSDVGGDIWFIRDVNTDGVAESIDHFMSIQVDGAEATGMIFNPAKPTEFVVAVQHADSTNLSLVPEGNGDALWKFDLSGVVPPVCQKGGRYKAYGHKKRNKVTACAKDKRVNYVKSLKKSSKGKRHYHRAW